MFSDLLEAAKKFPLSPPGTAMTKAYVIDLESGTCLMSDLTLPHRARSSEVAPRLLADNGAYTFGIGGDHRAQALHTAYLDLVERYASTGDVHAQAVLAYLAEHSEAPEEVVHDPKTFITFRHAGKIVAESPHLVFWWQEYLYQSGEGMMMCAVCGQEKPLPSAPHPKIIGLPASHTFGASLSPKASGEIPTVCGLCGATIATTLNFLLASPQHHTLLGDVVAVYWSSDGDCSPLLVGERSGVLGPVPTEGTVRVYFLKDQHKRLSLRGASVFHMKKAAPYLARFRDVQEQMTKTPALAPLAMAQMLAPIMKGSGPYVQTALAFVEMAFTGHALPLSCVPITRDWIRRTTGDPLAARLAALLSVKEGSPS